MREPKVEPDDRHSGLSRVSKERILFTEPVSFGSSDVSITNLNEAQVPFSLTGSGTDLMKISFGAVLFNDTYTITIADRVTSVATLVALDGDGDAAAGGDAVISMHHALWAAPTPTATLPQLLALAA